MRMMIRPSVFCLVGEFRYSFEHNDSSSFELRASKPGGNVCPEVAVTLRPPTGEFAQGNSSCTGPYRDEQLRSVVSLRQSAKLLHCQTIPGG
jgi:hypothetical protein